MRNPGDLSGGSARPQAKRPVSHTKRRIIIAAVVLVVIILIFSLKALATVYTDRLFFDSVGLSHEWDKLFAVKFGLFATFGVIFGLLLWGNLRIADRLTTWDRLLVPDDEIVKNYQAHLSKHMAWIRIVLSVIAGLIAGLGAIGQWKNWELFINGGSFPYKDPLFHMNAGFYVFKLPFLQFLVGWAFASLVVVFLFTMVMHYLNGGIRLQGKPPRVAPAVKAHLSLLLGLMALVKAGGYLLQRYTLDFSTSGFVRGAEYTDVHARLPAIELLFWISLAAFAVLMFNIFRRGWVLPVLAVGLWAFVALVVGVIYPALIQRLKVQPAEEVLEKPYIADNIQATRYAVGIQHVKVVPFQASRTLSQHTIDANAAELEDTRLWDPNLGHNTFEQLQDIRAYYTFNDLAFNRLNINGKTDPVVIGLRQINSNDLPDEGWVSKHLIYTHGYGGIVAPANTATTDGDPVFDLSSVPVQAQPGAPKITQPDVYFGMPGTTPGVRYVVVDTRQPELDYQESNGQNVMITYKGDGGVVLSNILTKAAFALRFGDLNLLVSNLLTPHSRILFYRNVLRRVATVAPFLKIGSNPYPVVVNGKLGWVVDAYTTTDEFPYAQQDKTEAVPSGGELTGSTFDYIRNSVKVFVSAYTGDMTFYVMNPHDPIIQAWERAFPSMFTPASKMPPMLEAQLRYPKDLLAVQAAMYGRYHITNPNAFYSAGDAWSIAESAGTGSPTASLLQPAPTNAAGVPIGPAQVRRMRPLYQMFTVPGSSDPSFDAVEAFVPVSSSARLQTLSAFLVANSDPSHYGQLTALVTPAGSSIDGPALIDARIEQQTTISREITLLDSGGSSVLLGHVVALPLGQSLVYVRPLYVQSSRQALPELKRVIVVDGRKVAMEDTLAEALDDVFGGPVHGLSKRGALAVEPRSRTTTTTPSTSAVPSTISQLLQQASADYAQGQSDLKAGNLGGYQSEMEKVGSLLNQANADMAKTSTTKTSPTISKSTPKAKAPPSSTSTSKTNAAMKKKTTKSTSVNPVSTNAA